AGSGFSTPGRSGRGASTCPSCSASCSSKRGKSGCITSIAKPARPGFPDEPARSLVCGVMTTSPEGIVTLRSRFGSIETVQRLEAEVTARKMTVFAKVDHGGGAVAAGLSLRPTVLVLFGAARGGTPLMQASQLAGIDLPLKALVWDDE